MSCEQKQIFDAYQVLSSIVKLGYAGVYLFFIFLFQNIVCGYSLEPPRQDGSNEYPQSMFEQI